MGVHYSSFRISLYTQSYVGASPARAIARGSKMFSARKLSAINTGAASTAIGEIGSYLRPDALVTDYSAS